LIHKKFPACTLRLLCAVGITSSYAFLYWYLWISSKFLRSITVNYMTTAIRLPLQSLQIDLTLLCSQIDPPLHSIHLNLILLCGHLCLPPHSSQCFFSLLCRFYFLVWTKLNKIDVWFQIWSWYSPAIRWISYYSTLLRIGLRNREGRSNTRNVIWFKVHHLTQYLRFLISLGGVILIIVTTQVHFTTGLDQFFHEQLGIAITGLGLIQVIFEWFHWWVGRTLPHRRISNIFWNSSFSS